ncbi:MAG: hypothetical protein ACTSRE_00450 [Promethearchaeota archaeon]
MSEKPLKRITSVDTGRGFGILLMILVHVFAHQIGGGLSDNFVPLLTSMHPILIGSLTPLIIMGVWGSAFTFLSCMALSAKIFQTDLKDNRTFVKIIFARIIGGFLVVLMFRLLHYITKFPDTESIYRQFGPIQLNFSSGTLDSIAIVGVLVPIILIILRKTRISEKIVPLSLTLIVLAVVFLSMSESFILWGRTLCDFFNQKGLYFLELCISKFVYGRFKVSQTFSFGLMGAVLGIYIVKDVSEKNYMRFSLACFLVGLLVIGVAAVFDWTFLLEFANNDVPIYVQFFNLGAQIGLFSIFNKYLELGTPERRVRAAKRTIWLRRFGIVSLTIFVMGRFVADGVYWVLEKWLGPAVDMSGENPVLAWNMGKIYLFMGIVVVIWLLIVFIWEKLEFIMSIEWMLGVISWILRMKKSVSLHSKSRIYGPTKLQSSQEREEKPRITK